MNIVIPEKTVVYMISRPARFSSAFMDLAITKEDTAVDEPKIKYRAPISYELKSKNRIAGTIAIIGLRTSLIKEAEKISPGFANRFFGFSWPPRPMRANGVVIAANSSITVLRNDGNLISVRDTITPATVPIIIGFFMTPIRTFLKLTSLPSGENAVRIMIAMVLKAIEANGSSIMVGIAPTSPNTLIDSATPIRTQLLLKLPWIYAPQVCLSLIKPGTISHRPNPRIIQIKIP